MTNPLDGNGVALLPMSSAPKDRPILAYCVNPEVCPDCGPRSLCLFHAHAEGLSSVEDGPHVVVWGGGFTDVGEYGAVEGSLPDWWFRFGSEFEEAANPIGWLPIGSTAPSHTAVEPVADRWAVYSPTGMHIGLWTERVLAEQVLTGYPPGYRIEPLWTASALTAQAAALVAAESNAERMERNWRTAAALVERHEATIEVQSNKLIAAEFEAATIKARVAELEAGLGAEAEACATVADLEAADADALFDMHSAYDTLTDTVRARIAGRRSSARGIALNIRARRLTHQEKNNGR